ncbi:ABC transporter permease [Tepidibacillus fermentans]|uniref:NitT/TauT family transport system permease protein n=1 Tax=Tepidibacillus fermentans TaxID=1281767 RepID=A0A4R3KJ43_9BACI|nr:ABC transporter permease [Tepidibacillus fermentans]TCS83479.1 NitT/TauT family transport system permease protein [Tepidibacillus fermentans]
MTMIKRFLSQGAKSEDHAQYLIQIRKNQIYVKITQIILLIFLIGIWEVSVRFGLLDEFIFSRPSKIWSLFLQMLATGELQHHIYVTLLETVIGFILGTVLGTLIATLIWISPFMAKVLDPYLVVLNGMPKVALGPIFIVSFGAGYVSIIAMALAISIIITTIVVYTSFKEVDPNYLKLAQTFGAKKYQIFFKIILPASFPTIVSTLKVNVGLSWVGVIVGEFLVSKAGLGYLIIYGFQVFNLALVMMSLLIISIAATLMYQIVAYIEKKILSIHE